MAMKVRATPGKLKYIKLSKEVTALASKSVEYLIGKPRIKLTR